jgi:hypothetical protein
LKYAFNEPSSGLIVAASWGVLRPFMTAFMSAQPG